MNGRLTLFLIGAITCWSSVICQAGIVFDAAQSMSYAEINEAPNRNVILDSSLAQIVGPGDYIAAVVGADPSLSWANNDVSVTSSNSIITITGQQSLADLAFDEGALTGTLINISLDCEYSYSLDGEFITTGNVEGEFHLVSDGVRFSATSIYGSTFSDSGALSVGSHVVIAPFASSGLAFGEYNWTLTLEPTGETCELSQPVPEPVCWALLLPVFLWSRRWRV